MDPSGDNTKPVPVPVPENKGFWDSLFDRLNVKEWIFVGILILLLLIILLLVRIICRDRKKFVVAPAAYQEVFDEEPKQVMDNKASVESMDPSLKESFDSRGTGNTNPGIGNNMNINASDGRYDSMTSDKKFKIGGHNFLDRAQSETADISGLQSSSSITPSGPAEYNNNL